MRNTSLLTDVKDKLTTLIQQMQLIAFVIRNMYVRIYEQSRNNIFDYK